jgi:hypothetical protein
VENGAKKALTACALRGILEEREANVAFDNEAIEWWITNMESRVAEAEAEAELMQNIVSITLDALRSHWWSRAALRLTRRGK